MEVIIQDRSFDIYNNLVGYDNEKQTIKKKYDENGNILSINTSYKDSSNFYIIKFKYNEKNQFLSKIKYSSINNVRTRKTVSAEYDENDNLIVLNSDDSKTTFEYDIDNKIHRSITLSNNGDHTLKSYKYDLNHNISIETYTNSQKTSVQVLDKNENVLHEIYFDKDEDIKYVYNDDNKLIYSIHKDLNGYVKLVNTYIINNGKVVTYISTQGDIIVCEEKEYDEKGNEIICKQYINGDLRTIINYNNTYGVYQIV